MAKRRAAWMWAAWTLAAGGCTTLVGLDDPYHPVEGAGGGSGGMSSVTASAASGGAGGGEPVGSTDVDLIDDMEDGDGAIEKVGGRVGYWYSYNDGTGTQTPPVSTEEMHVGFLPEALTPPRGQSTMAMHTFGSGFTDWGAGVRFPLNRPEMVALAYDASAYTGIVFWARLGDAGAVTTMKVNISDTVSEPAGGICDESAGVGDPDRCYDHWSYDASLGAEWSQIVIPFEELAREGWGAEPTAQAIDIAALYAIEFRFAQGEDFDVYIDDISFTR
ncbi:carbohydrate binding domain-containing protein [Sorangium cellulosum]|uniref:hypothetical protein n=1 Tax=Sorangium cellulosum TaxID=56 RepID=UPI003D9A2F5C